MSEWISGNIRQMTTFFFFWVCCNSPQWLLNWLSFNILEVSKTESEQISYSWYAICRAYDKMLRLSPVRYATNEGGFISQLVCNYCRPKIKPLRYEIPCVWKTTCFYKSYCETDYFPVGVFIILMVSTPLVTIIE